MVVPAAEVCEYTAQRLAGEAESDFEDLDAYDLAWSALLRMLDRTCPDCTTGVGNASVPVSPVTTTTAVAHASSSLLPSPSPGTPTPCQKAPTR
ncbi:hypothetical protein [Streptomyces griseoluteus]